MPVHRRRPVPRVLPPLLVLAVAAFGLEAAAAGKPNCREIEFDGAATITSADIVRFRVVDRTGRILDQSCPIRVQGAENAVDYARRVPAAWGPGSGAIAETLGQCPPSAPPGLPVPVSKTCGSVVAQRSCTHTFVYKLKDPPVLPKVRICCVRSTKTPALGDCKGKKLGKVKECIGGANAGVLCESGAECTSGVCEATNDISVQTQRDGDPPGFSPAVPPTAAVVVAQVALDPISVVQRPSASLRGCRSVLGKATTAFARATSDALVGCNAEVMKGALDPSTDCNHINPVSDLSGGVAVAAAALDATAAASCLPLGSPSTFGYAACPAPCDSLGSLTCTAGAVGSPCVKDPHCDTAPGVLDGRCGDWSQTTQCIRCLAENAISAAMEDKYGVLGPPPGLDPSVQKCQTTIGLALASLVGAELLDTTVCQDLVDRGRGALGFCQLGQCTAPPAQVGLACTGDDGCSPAENRLCKYADPAGRKGAASADAATLIAKACQDPDLSQLSTCALTVPTVEDCVIQNGRTVATAIADALYPEGAAAVLPSTTTVTTTTTTTTLPCLTPIFVTQWGSPGTGNGQFQVPVGVAVDGSGNVFVADYGNHRIQKFTSTGTFLTKWGSLGTGNGGFNVPAGVTVDGGNVYVADLNNDRIQKFDGSGTFLTKWGSPGTGNGQFDGPLGMGVDGSGNVYVSDVHNNRIQKFRNNGAFLTKWGSLGTGDGQFNGPEGVAVDGSGNVYVADFVNNRIQKFDGAGVFLTQWGTLGTGDGQFNNGPVGVAVDGSGNVYVTDDGNHTVQKFDGTGIFLTRLGDPGQFAFPDGVAVDGSGNVYVADTGFNRIQKFSCPP